MTLMANSHLVDFWPPASSKTWTLPVHTRSREHGGQNLLPKPRLERGVAARKQLEKLLPGKRPSRMGKKGRMAKALQEVGGN